MGLEESGKAGVGATMGQSGRLGRAAVVAALVTVLWCSKEMAKSIAASKVVGFIISTRVFMGSSKLFVKISRSSSSAMGAHERDSRGIVWSIPPQCRSSEWRSVHQRGWRLSTVRSGW